MDGKALTPRLSSDLAILFGSQGSSQQHACHAIDSATDIAVRQHRLDSEMPASWHRPIPYHNFR